MKYNVVPQHPVSNTIRAMRTILMKEIIINPHTISNVTTIVP